MLALATVFNSPLNNDPPASENARIVIHAVTCPISNDNGRTYTIHISAVHGTISQDMQATLIQATFHPQSSNLSPLWSALYDPNTKLMKCPACRYIQLSIGIRVNALHGRIESLAILQDVIKDAINTAKAKVNCFDALQVQIVRTTSPTETQLHFPMTFTPYGTLISPMQGETVPQSLHTFRQECIDVLRERSSIYYMPFLQ